MTGRLSPKEDPAQIQPDRRAMLRQLAALSLGGAAILLAGCGNSIPPRQYKRPASAMYYGGRGKGNR